jgi:proteic killer suppression protein
VGDGHGDLRWCWSDPPGSRLDPRAVERRRRLVSAAHRNSADRTLHNDRVVAKLQALHAADTLDFLRVPPPNRLEQLREDREGQWSIRINDQWRICFRWEDPDAYDVEVTDCH